MFYTYNTHKTPYIYYRYKYKYEIQIQIILFYIELKTFTTSYFSIVNINTIIELFTIKINLKHYTYYNDILDRPTLLTLF